MATLASTLPLTSILVRHIERMMLMLWLMCCPKGLFRSNDTQYERLEIWRKQSLR